MQSLCTRMNRPAYVDAPRTHFMQCGMCSNALPTRQLRHCTAAALFAGALKSSSSDANWPQISRGQNMRGAGSSSMSSCRGFVVTQVMSNNTGDE